MSYLLDTSSFLWFVNDDKKLSAAARELVEDPDVEIQLSVVSIWEIAIKARLGRGLDLPLPFIEFIDAVLDNYDFAILQISISHLKQVADLPFHHRDPFDRLLVAQSQVENLPILTSDAAFDQYPVQRLW